MQILFAGTKLSFRVPDAFHHENEIRNFVIGTDHGNKKLFLMYIDNECKCKDGWIKFEDLPLTEGTLGTTRDLLIAYFERYYSGKFDPKTLNIA